MKTETLQNGLAKIVLNTDVRLPLNPNMVVKGLLVDQCRWLDSNTFPLWLVFQNADVHGKPISVIFKNGDDLRQDILTLQMFSLMDRIWKSNGMDLHLTTYLCVATGEGKGLVEVVLDSKTTAQIQKESGGVTSVFKKTPLLNHLQQNNPNQKDLEAAIQNFTKSCAGMYQFEKNLY